MPPRFSVVVPLYNKRPYIRRCVESVLGQSFTDFELIVVDDGSTDGSADALSGVRDPRLRLVRQENQGEGPARNTGMNLARGEWVALLDADDAWLDCHLDELSRIATVYPQAGLISTACIESRGIEIPASLTRDTVAAIREVDYFCEAAKKMGFINATSTAIRRGAIPDIGYFSSKKTGADLEYWIKAALKYPVAVSSRVTCVYFRETGGVIQRLSQQREMQSESPPLSLREFSTPVALLFTMAEEDPTLLQQANIRAYINGVLTVALRGALYRGHFHNARHYAKLYLQPYSLREHLVRLVLWLPDQSLRLLRGGAMRIKRSR